MVLDTELQREVALKQILDSQVDGPSSRRRFLLEAETTGGLEHTGIVPAYGLGTYGDGCPYYAMRFIRGNSLKEAVAAFHTDESLTRDPGQRSLGLLKLLRRFDDPGTVLRAVQEGNFAPPCQLDPALGRALEAVYRKANAPRSWPTSTRASFGSSSTWRSLFPGRPIRAGESSGRPA